MLAIYCKGLCEPNPDGWMAWAFVAVDPDTGQMFERQLGSVAPPAVKGEKRATNFVAEYGAILRAVEWLRGYTDQPATIYASLSSVLSRLGGSWPPEGNDMKERMLAKTLAVSAGRPIAWAWVATEQNPANPLAQAAYAQATGHKPTDWVARRKQQQVTR